jgi:hypothetical protein
MEGYYYNGNLSELMHMKLYRKLESHLNKASYYMIQHGEKKIGKMKYPPVYEEKKITDYVTYKCASCKRHQEAARNLTLEPCSVCGGVWEVYVKKEDETRGRKSKVEA